MSNTHTAKLNKRGKVRKTLDFDLAFAKRTNAMLKRDKRGRSFRQLVQDLLDAEYERITGKVA